MGAAVKFVGRLFGAVPGFATGGMSNALASVPLTFAALSGNPLLIAAAVAGDLYRTFARNGAPSSRGNLSPVVIRQAITDSFILYGERRVVNLKLVFFHSKKVGKRHYRYFVFAIAGHRIKGEPAWMLNDEEVSVDGAGKVTSGDYADKVWLWLQRGLDAETANATFVAECGGKWTSAHKGNGVAAIYMKAEMTDKIVEAGFCTPAPVVKGKDDIFDYRDDTEKYTSSAVLVSYDYMRLPREEGGFGAYEDEIPDPAWISAQANVCDETVEGQPRYALNGFIVTGAAPSEVRSSLIVNMAGSYAYVGGKHLIRPGYWNPVSVTLSEDTLAGPVEISPFLTGDVAASEVQGSYVEPADNYQAAPFATQAASPAPADVRQADLDLGWTTNKHQAERVARIMLGRAQCEKQVVWPANIEGLKAQALDTARFDTERYGLGDYAFVVTGWSFAIDADAVKVVIAGREENEAIYDDPAPVAPPSVDPISPGLPVLLDRDLSTLINTSSQTLLTVSADSTTITISDHIRRYVDQDVAVTGDTIARTDEAEDNYVFYDDPERTGGAVTYQVTEDYFEAFPSAATPDRHFAAFVPANATSGGGSLPPSGGGASPYNVDP